MKVYIAFVLTLALLCCMWVGIAIKSSGDSIGLPWLFFYILFLTPVAIVVPIILAPVFRAIFPPKRPVSLLGKMKVHVLAEWRQWPDQSSPPTLAEIRAFYEWLSKAHPEMLIFQGTRAGWYEIQEWCDGKGA